MTEWNPWHGCHKFSAGCLNCYMFRRDEQIGLDCNIIRQTKSFNLPLMKNKNKQYKITSLDDPVYVCLTSDFFIEEADQWREAVWDIIRSRSDLHFKIITKRIHRLMECIPYDWDDGYENVTIICTCENQQTADERLPVFLSLPIAHREIIHEPMLESIEISDYLSGGGIEAVTCGGESGSRARICDYSWILNTREQCIANNVSFYFKQTGANFRKDGRVFHIERKLQMPQALKAGINFHSTIQSSQVNNKYDTIFRRIEASEFRSSFKLDEKDIKYIDDKGMDIIRRHAFDFIRQRLAPAFLKNDGKQTPMRGHPVFKAQHATATCCRNCMKKWHGIPVGTALREDDINFAVNLIMEWIERQRKNNSSLKTNIE